MYSVVLAAMLTAGPAATPAWSHGCHGCCGGYSCCGGYNAFSHSCCGGGYSCCGGYSYCCGGSSCCGGWYSCSCGGYSCGGGWYPSYWTCCGGSSCYGCCGGSCCCGGWYSCGGYCDGGGWYRGCSGWAPVYPAYGGGVMAAPVVTPMPKPRDMPESAAPAAPATVVIKAPLDVHITINAQPINRQSPEQVFTTSDLQSGKTYSYDIQAEAVRGGKTVTRTQTVIVKAGQESRADFGDLTAADGVAHVSIAAPADARVTVDGVEVPSSARTFSTPALEAGRTYYYTVTAETTRDGRKVSDSRRVLVAAGQDVSVEFKESGVTTAGK